MNTYRETQATIKQWADAAFGPASSTASSIARANKEMAELLMLVSAPTFVVMDVIDEAADVYICLARDAADGGFDINERDAGCLMPLVGDWNARESAGMANSWLATLFNNVSHHGYNRFTRQACTWVVAYLDYLVRSLRGDLLAAVDAKMAVNRRRQWRRDGNGHGYHIEGSLFERQRAAEFAESLDKDP